MGSHLTDTIGEVSQDPYQYDPYTAQPPMGNQQNQPTSGGYPDQSGYPDQQAGYPDQAQQGQYAQQPGYQQQPGYAQQPGYVQQPQPYAQYGYTTPMQPQGGDQQNGLAIAGMVCGIASIPLLFCCYSGTIPAILGIIFGAIGMGKANRGEAGGKGMALAGLICGAATIVLLAIIIVASIAFNWSAVYSNYGTN